MSDDRPTTDAPAPAESPTVPATPVTATTAPTRNPAATLRLLALGGLAVGAVLALVAGSRSWWRAAGTGVSVAFSGTETTGGLAQALALVVLAGALLGLVLRRRGRQVLGVLLALAGAGALVLGLLRPRPASGTVQSRVLEVSLADQFSLVGTAWPYVYAVAGLAVLAAAALMSATAPRWPTRTSRFDRPGTTAVPDPVPTTGPLGEDDPAALWKLLDAGVDPTAPASDAPDASHAGDGTTPGATPRGDAGHIAQPAAPTTANHLRAPGAGPTSTGT